MNILAEVYPLINGYRFGTLLRIMEEPRRGRSSDRQLSLNKQHYKMNKIFYVYVFLNCLLYNTNKANVIMLILTY